MPPAPLIHSTQPYSQLSISAKAGVIAASIVVFLCLLLVILEYTYLRRKRQERALKQAVDEVERGTELKELTTGESKEIMVLESRIEIVVDDENEHSVRSSWDGEVQWNAGTEGDDSDGDLGEWGRGMRWERGRNGMSLPRAES
jgi:flagellar biosynthesis/type III secretory pathway M-ring protein FliF/YscJ